MEIGKAIRELRKKKGFSQKELALKCGLSVNALCQIELGNTFPQKSTINKVCEILNVNICVLFFKCIEDDVPESKKEVFNVLKNVFV